MANDQGCCKLLRLAQQFTQQYRVRVIDEIWLYAVNSSASSVKLTLEWGEATAPDGNIELSVAAESGLVLVTAGLLLQNSLVVKALTVALLDTLLAVSLLLRMWRVLRNFYSLPKPIQLFQVR
jgi:hypothetical protein